MYYEIQIVFMKTLLFLRLNCAQDAPIFISQCIRAWIIDVDECDILTIILVHL